MTGVPFSRLRARMPARITLVAALLTASACGGPETPLDISAREVPLDLLLGKRPAVAAEAPIPPLVIPVAAFEPGGVLSDEPAPGLPPPRFLPPPPPDEPPPSDCPERDPLTPPRLTAFNKIDHPPVQASYAYRTQGQITAPGGKVLVLSPQSTVLVGNVVAESTGWTFNVTLYNSAVPPSTFKYRVLVPTVDATTPAIIGQPEAPSNVPFPSAGQPGLYLAERDDFKPPFPGLAMARFPLEPGDAFDTSASDGSTTIRHRSVVEKKSTFDACGVPIDVWVLTITGTVVTASAPTDPVEFAQVLALGTQYGGLFVSHRTDSRSNASSSSVQILASTEPQEAK